MRGHCSIQAEGDGGLGQALGQMHVVMQWTRLDLGVRGRSYLGVLFEVPGTSLPHSFHLVLSSLQNLPCAP